MARVVRPGGTVVVVDFLKHEHEWMRQELRVVWLGFPEVSVQEWFAQAGLPDLRIDVERSAPRGRDLPDTFIASARRPV
jgi:ArsR family transcriptional regulator